MKQTPIQKLIAKYEKEVEDIKDLIDKEDSCSLHQSSLRKKIVSYNVFINQLQSLLAEERQMVEDAYMSGQSNFDLNAGLLPSQYFNNKYQQ